jgi:antitoxin component YwqK of YwqJK toxin-antitoxin module
MNLNDPKNTKPPPIKPLRHKIRYYPNSNNKEEEYDLNENNEMHGIYQIWHRNGRIFVRINYQDGFRHGLYERWYSDGSLQARHYYKNGKIES